MGAQGPSLRVQPQRGIPTKRRSWLAPTANCPPASGDVADAEATATGTWDNFNRTYTDHWGWTSSGVPWYTNVIHDWQG